MAKPRAFPGRDGREIDQGLVDLACRSPRDLERAFFSREISAVAGVDEVGRGPLAGPVVACACVLPPEAEFHGLRDSKALSEAARESLRQQITAYPGVVFALSVVDHTTVDQLNILQATLLAMGRALESLSIRPQVVLIDGICAPRGLEAPSLCIPQGDVHCRPITAASIIAKCFRDQMMREYDLIWPCYGFAEHKGYGTPHHLAQLGQYGPCPIHRTSFAPVREVMSRGVPCAPAPLPGP